MPSGAAPVADITVVAEEAPGQGPGQHIPVHRRSGEPAGLDRGAGGGWRSEGAAGPAASPSRTRGTPWPCPADRRPELAGGTHGLGARGAQMPGDDLV